MAQCVFCEATDNLNTQISINLDGGKKVVVDICDTHADDATPKSAKAAYLEKQGKAEALIAQLKAMGMDVSSLGQTGKIITATLTEKPKPKPVVQETEVWEDDLKGDDVIDTTVLDSKSRGMVSSGGAAAMGGSSVPVSGHSSFDVTGAANGLPPDQRTALLQARKGKAKLVVMEGRDGQQLVIPEKRVDGMGTTRLKIVKKEDDVRLQSRFKKMAKDSIDRDRVPDFARSGYSNTQADCPMCHGHCTIVHNKREVSCPKCNGAGVISVY